MQYTTFEIFALQNDGRLCVDEFQALLKQRLAAVDLLLGLLASDLGGGGDGHAGLKLPNVVLGRAHLGLTSAPPGIAAGQIVRRTVGVDVEELLLLAGG